jgi:hypothetical protein
MSAARMSAVITAHQSSDILMPDDAGVVSDFGVGSDAILIPLK